MKQSTYGQCTGKGIGWQHTVPAQAPVQRVLLAHGMMVCRCFEIKKIIPQMKTANQQGSGNKPGGNGFPVDDPFPDAEKTRDENEFNACEWMGKRKQSKKENGCHPVLPEQVKNTSKEQRVVIGLTGKEKGPSQVQAPPPAFRI